MVSFLERKTALLVQGPLQFLMLWAAVSRRTAAPTLGEWLAIQSGRNPAEAARARAHQGCGIARAHALLSSQQFRRCDLGVGVRGAARQHQELHRPAVRLACLAEPTSSSFHQAVPEVLAQECRLTTREGDDLVEARDRRRERQRAPFMIADIVSELVLHGADLRCQGVVRMGRSQTPDARDGLDSRPGVEEGVDAGQLRDKARLECQHASRVGIRSLFATAAACRELRCIAGGRLTD